MKKIIYFGCLFLFYGCIFTYDPPRALLYIHNNSNDAVYVYFHEGKADSLHKFTGLELFDFIDVYEEDTYTLGGTRKKPRLPGNLTEITLFFITRNTVENYDFEEIYKNQMFERKVTLTNDELEKMGWEYIYTP